MFDSNICFIVYTASLKGLLIGHVFYPDKKNISPYQKKKTLRNFIVARGFTKIQVTCTKRTRIRTTMHGSQKCLTHNEFGVVQIKQDSTDCVHLNFYELTQTLGNSFPFFYYLIAEKTSPNSSQINCLLISP